MNEIITVYTFLDKVLNLYCTTHTKLHFSEDPWHITDNQTLSVYYKLQEIEALTKAFGLYNPIKNTRKSNFKGLLEGVFLPDKPYLKSNPIIFDEVTAFFQSQNIRIEKQEIENMNIMRLYKRLLSFLLDIQLAKYKNDYIIIEGKNLESAFVYHIVQQTKVDALNNIITSIWNPNNYEFSKDLLIQDFGYPDIDISQIEREERDRFMDDFFI